MMKSDFSGRRFQVIHKSEPPVTLQRRQVDLRRHFVIKRRFCKTRPFHLPKAECPIFIPIGWMSPITCLHSIVWWIWNFDTNEYPNIFVLRKTIRTNIWIYLYQKNNMNEYPNIFVSKNNTNMIRTNICSGNYLNIFEYPNIRHTMCSSF